jgi:hypothetical protein
MIILGLMPKNGGGPYYNVGYVVRVLSDLVGELLSSGGFLSKW